MPHLRHIKIHTTTHAIITYGIFPSSLLVLFLVYLPVPVMHLLFFYFLLFEQYIHDILLTVHTLYIIVHIVSQDQP
jgi:hypothetical protein